MDQLLTIDQAFEAMRRFLVQFNEREPPERKETIQFILSWTSRTGWAGGGTSDPAQWSDWEASWPRPCPAEWSSFTSPGPGQTSFRHRGLAVGRHA